MRFHSVALFILGFSGVASASPITLGTLEMDRATLNTISFSLPFTGDTNENATATVEYKQGGDTTWDFGLNPMRIRPAFIGISRGTEFAGSIFGLDPDLEYEIRVVVDDPDGGGGTERTRTRTRSVPRLMPDVPNIVAVASGSEFSAALSAAVPGDVIAISGSFTGDHVLAASGTPQNPIVIACESGVAISGSGSSPLRVNGDNVVVRDCTFNANSGGYALQTTGSDQRNVVIRGNQLNGDRGIRVQGATFRDYFICDNTLVGTNVWPDISSGTWNDEGILVVGRGHVVCFNELEGFGDSMGLSSQTSLSNRAMDFHNNLVTSGGDDALELDKSERNVRAYDNLIINSGVVISVQHDNDTGGPVYAFRNVGINTARSPIKLNDSPSGIYLVNNSIVSSEGHVAGRSIWHQFNNGSVDNFFFENNIFYAHHNPTDILTFGPPISFGVFNYNGYYPDGRFTFSSGTYANLAALQAGTAWEASGVILTTDLFETAPTLASDFTTLAPLQVPTLSATSSAKDVGTVYVNINDDFTGSAPDLGALEEGRPAPHYGPGTWPEPPVNVMVVASP